MNSKAARELVEKILIADKIIHEETLGIDYTGPDKPLLRKEDLPSYVKAIEAIKQGINLSKFNVLIFTKIIMCKNKFNFTRERKARG